MTETSPRLKLPFIQAAQAQKHVTHNEALELLDVLVQLSVELFAATTPPDTPIDGQVWALGAAPVGDWAGHSGELAVWANGGWLFVSPAAGWRAAMGTSLRVYDGTDWQLPDPPALDNLPGLGIGSAHDAVNRLSVASESSLFSHAGSGHQLKLNKAGLTDTASVLFQTGWSGRAEFGLAGEDDWSVKVSADGASWQTALWADRNTGVVNLPAGLNVQGALDVPPASVARGALAEGAARSVIGRALGTSGAVSDIAAGSDHQVLRRVGAELGFGAVALNQSAAVSGELPLVRGGTGATTAASARTNLGLGTAAVADVTNSSTDTTPNRVLRTGDFGIGSAAAPAATDLAESIPNGLYRVGGTATNGPSLGYSSGSTLYSAQWDGNNWSRLLVDGAGSSEASAPRLWLRAKNFGTMKNWFQVYHQGRILGPVSQDSGVPSGALIERGSNSNGTYVRFADGTQICQQAVAADTANATTWTFPAAFTSAPQLHGTAQATVLSALCLDTAPTTTFCTFSLRDKADARRSDTAHLTAIGHWF